MSNKKKLPIIISGAGPCGLVSALVLKKHGIPFIILEKSSSSKLCSNVGSGYDLAPTTIDILKDRLELPIEKAFTKYEGMFMCDMQGKLVRGCRITEMGQSYKALAASRAIMQNVFLDSLLGEKWRDQSNEDNAGNGMNQIFHLKEGDGVLQCGVGVHAYEENEKDQSVTVTLSDGTKIVGSVLLGCDGIHSAVRRCMMEAVLSKGDEDRLHFCNTDCWWGKTTIQEGSELQKTIKETQRYHTEGSSFIWMLGSGKQPGAFMGAPYGDNLFMWAFFLQAKLPPTKSSTDLTRRGGYVLDDEGKKKLNQSVADRGSLIKSIIKETPASVITNVGLFDRENLNLPYVNGRVALLGDAAHAQSPFMGQGVNMAIVDAYVVCTRLSKQSVTDALLSFDTKERRQGVNKIIGSARSFGNLSVTTNSFICWLFKLLTRWMPLSWILGEMLVADKPNAEFVAKLDAEINHLYCQSKKQKKE